MDGIRSFSVLPNAGKAGFATGFGVGRSAVRTTGFEGTAAAFGTLCGTETGAGALFAFGESAAGKELCKSSSSNKSSIVCAKIAGENNSIENRIKTCFIAPADKKGLTFDIYSINRVLLFFKQESEL